LGVSLKFRKGFFFNLIFLLFFNEVYAQDKNPDRDSDETARLEYYKYWNPYRRVLDLRGEPQSFYGQIYYQATYNKDNRIKTVTRFGKDRKPKETYSLLWSRSGARSEYKVTFHELGNVSRLDKNLYSNELSNMRPGWVASFVSRSDGRPKEVFFTDSVGFEYFSYNFNYTIVKDDKQFSEVVESSYFDSDKKFVGRHLLFWEKGAYLKMIQYFNSDNVTVETIEFINDKRLGETIRVLTDGEGKELERKIIPYMPPDKYAYKYEWDGENIIDRGLQDLEDLDLALEFALRAEEALAEANDKLIAAKEELDQANQRARNATKLMRKAEGQARDVEAFRARMDDAKVDAQKAIENMYDAEREAERARLEAASATATLGAVQKTKEVETFAQQQAKLAKKEAKRLRREARKKARDAKRAVQDSLLGSGPKSYLNLSFSQPLIVEKTLENHIAGLNYSFGLGRKNMFRFDDKPIDLGLEINWFDFKSDSIGQNFQTLSYFLIAQVDPRIAWAWVPSTMETGIKIGGGFVSPGYGFTLGGSAIFNLLPTPLIIGATTQFNYVSGIINENTKTNWVTVGLVFGVKVQDKLPSIFDIDLPDILDIF
jgi:hypothetical protein